MLEARRRPPPLKMSICRGHGGGGQTMARTPKTSPRLVSRVGGGGAQRKVRTLKTSTKACFRVEVGQGSGGGGIY